MQSNITRTLSDRTNHDEGLVIGCVLVPVFFAGKNEHKIPLLHRALGSVLTDQRPATLYNIIEMLEGMRVVGRMSLRLNRKDPHRKIGSAVLPRYGDLLVRISCSFHVHPYLLDIVKIGDFHRPPPSTQLTALSPCEQA